MIRWEIPFALIVSSGSVLVLLNGFLGTAGIPWLTALILGGAPLALLASGNLRDARTELGDILYLAFGLVVLTSMAVNPPPTRDGLLFVMSLSAYPAGRFMPTAGNFGVFNRATGTIVIMGTIATASALAGQWYYPHGKPIVFGFSHAGSVFLASLAFLLIAIVCFGNLGRTRLIACLIMPPLIVFAAAQVRFTFLAIVGALAVAAVVSPAPRRSGIAAIIGVVAISVVIGLAIRPDTSKVFLNYIIAPAQAASEPSPAPVECNETNNSVAIRKTLWREGLLALPSAGLFGTGLSSSARASCFRMDPHNALLQTFIEFGFVGGAILLIFMVATIWRLLPLAAGSQVARFALASLTFVVLIDMAHGHLTGSALLFLFLGMGSGLKVDT